MTVGIDEIMSSYVFSVELVTVQQRRINLANSNRERERETILRSAAQCLADEFTMYIKIIKAFYVFSCSLKVCSLNPTISCLTSLDSLDMEPLWRLCIFERHGRWCCHRLACWYGQRRWCLQHDKEASQNKPIVRFQTTNNHNYHNWL